jgi:hypothetical protein
MKKTIKMPIKKETNKNGKVSEIMEGFRFVTFVTGLWSSSLEVGRGANNPSP